MFKVMSLLSIDIEVVVFFAQQSSSWCKKCINAVVKHTEGSFLWSFAFQKYVSCQ